MSMWQWKKWPLHVPERYIYLGKLFLLSFSLHGLLFFAVLFFYQFHYSSRFSIVINQRLNNAKIVYVPTLKTVPGSLAALAQKNNNQQSKKIVQTTPLKKAPVKKVINPKKIEPSKPKAQLVKKIPIKKETQAKKIVQKIEQKKQENFSKHEQQVITKTNNKTGQDIIYIGRDDKSLLAIHNQIQGEIEKIWHPPVGLSKDLVCSIKVKLDTKGSIFDLAVEESSTVISYDIAARTALDLISFPRSLWGKELVITFKQ